MAKSSSVFFSGKVEIVETSDKIIHSVTLTIRMPVVIHLLKYVPPQKLKKIVRFNRNSICLRDNYTCQYCGDKTPQMQLIMNHVVTIFKGGNKSWENMVTAPCRGCYLKKVARTPDEAGMRLNKFPGPAASVLADFQARVRAVP